MPVSLFSADVNTKCQRFGGITGQEKILVVVFVADEAVEYTPWPGGGARFFFTITVDRGACELWIASAIWN